ncbi:MAG: nitrogenase molybdenum-iron protein [Ruminococcus sp.]|nr:nitrogenase molybdenum-iron protein [Ruminococcus sp.]
MKNLLKLLSPFAPDQSGAVGVLYELGGLVVICDAGGCAGNICGFDEPRWFTKKSAVFSAGLRDMDAILGRDDKLIEKTARAVGQTQVKFTAVVGTPVPAVIATDYRALKRMAENKTSLPAICVDCTGTRLYDDGEERAYLELFRTFSTKEYETEKGKVGIIGCTPLASGYMTEKIFKGEYGNGAVTFGMGSGIEDISKAAQCEKNIVVSTGGIKAAQYLKQTYGIPYETDFPVTAAMQKVLEQDLSGKKVLAVHQQFAVNKMRKLLKERFDCTVDVATFFKLFDEFAQQGDEHLSDEEQLVRKVSEGGYDAVIIDSICNRALKGYRGELIDLPHFAVSGRLDENGGQVCLA